MYFCGSLVLYRDQKINEPIILSGREPCVRDIRGKPGPGAFGRGGLEAPAVLREARPWSVGSCHAIQGNALTYHHTQFAALVGVDEAAVVVHFPGDRHGFFEHGAYATEFHL